MKIASGVVSGALLGALSFNAIGAIIDVGPYRFDDIAIADEVTSYSGTTMDNGVEFVDPLTSTELIDTNAGTFLATNTADGWNDVTLGMRFKQVNVVNGANADLALFFMFEQRVDDLAANNIGFSVNGTDFSPLSFTKVTNPPQQVVNNVEWGAGQFLDNVLLLVAEVDLGTFGVDSLNQFTLSMQQMTDQKVVALSMVGAINYTVVPVPAAVWLFGSGLIGLVGVARRKK